MRYVFRSYLRPYLLAFRHLGAGKHLNTKFQACERRLQRYVNYTNASIFTVFQSDGEPYIDVVCAVTAQHVIYKSSLSVEAWRCLVRDASAFDGDAACGWYALCVKRPISALDWTKRVSLLVNTL